MAFNMQRQQLPDRMKYESKYNVARGHLLLVVILSLVNIILLAVDASIYFPFSLSLPYYMITGARLICGMYPEEFYAELAEITGEPVMTEFLPSVVFTVVLVICVIIIAVFSLCWLLSKKKIGWMIAALVLFVLDTFYLLSMGLMVEMLIDIIFHAWVLYSLISGIVAFFKMKALPDEDIFVFEPAAPATDNAADEPAEQSTEEATEEATEAATEAATDAVDEEEPAEESNNTALIIGIIAAVVVIAVIVIVVLKKKKK